MEAPSKLLIDAVCGGINMTELIYLDIDGTLRDEGKGIPESAVWAIERCREQAVRIVICTGRSPGTVWEDVMTLPADGIISGGGCFIQYHGKEIRRKHFSDETLYRVVCAAAAKEMALSLEAERIIYMDGRASAFYREDFQKKLRLTGGCTDGGGLNQIGYENNFHRFQYGKEKIHKICMFGKKNDVEQMEREFRKDAEAVQKKQWNDWWYLEMLPHGCDKGSAVIRLNRELGIPKNRTMSFGDSENDIPMFQATGIAVVMAGAPPSVGKYASSVCETADKDGIYKELVRRKMIRPYGKGRSDANGKTMVASGSDLPDLSQELL